MRSLSWQTRIYAFILTLLMTSLLEANVMMIDDFEPGSKVNWEYLSDQVMGGVSEGSARVGTDNETGNAYAHMTGNVSTDNNGGFIQLRARLQSGVGKDMSGIYLRARGNNEKYYIHLRTRGTMLPWQYYQAEFEVTDQWQVFRLPLVDFSPSGSWLSKSPKPKSIRSVGIVAYGRDHLASIDVDEIGFYD